MSKIIFLFLSLFTLSSCIRNPVTGKKELTVISEQQEVSIGHDNFRSMQQAEGGPFTADKTLCEYVSRVGNKLARASARSHLPYEFVIVNDSTPNAWTLPGGKIAINRGLLTELHSEAELAAVLGHEIVHADARHGAKGIERGMLLQGGVVALGTLMNNTKYNDILVQGGSVGAMLINQKYGRGHEFEADRYGMVYMTEAGYDPHAAVQLQETFLRLSKDKDPNWVEGLFASHPPTRDRIEANRATLTTLKSNKGFTGEKEYKEATSWLTSHQSSYKSYEKGKKALASKSYKSAQKLADEALSSCPEEALFWHLKGEALLAQKSPVPAQKAFSEAISRNPNNFDFYLKRAQAKKSLKDLSGAQVDLRKSLALLPTGEGHELLGRLLLMSGKRKEAIQHLQIASKAESNAGKKAQKLLEHLSRTK
ncbi:MAG: M48 family metalloprotease [Verrucomicrobia bacterium]|nr:M48 family metalloprotease [Verrucomicrobiota bacterium]